MASQVLVYLTFIYDHYHKVLTGARGAYTTYDNGPRPLRHSTTTYDTQKLPNILFK